MVLRANDNRLPEIARPLAEPLRPLRLGLAGAGRFGQLHASVLARLPGYRQLQTRSLVPHLSGTDGAWVSLIERVS